MRTAIVSSETFVSEVRTSVGSEAYLPVRARWCVRSGARMRGASCSEVRAECIVQGSACGVVRVDAVCHAVYPQCIIVQRVTRRWVGRT